LANIDKINDCTKPRPFALQMHNGGLLDEYGNVRVEIDPKDDKLITAE
jgi:hypothetical protein